MQAFTNGAQVSSAPKGNLTMTSFATSPKMQTYLNAFDVGYYELMEKTSNSGVKVRTIARPGRKDQMPYALKAATESLNQLEQFFGIPYPLPKLDLIATPECLVAMENWGLIHMEEDGLLYKEEFSNEEIKQNLLIRWLPHEIAHMWFGNLVTMSWWDDLWLNEAFADYYNYHEASPISNMAWNMPAQFVQINVCSSLELDGYESSRPVVEPVNTPSLSMFDDIVYKKGSSVIRMIVHKIGHDKFTRAMKKYLKKHSYGNANTNDVWAALESVTQGNGIYYKNVFEPWVHNVGFPVVTIRESSGKYIASQKRFVYLKDKTDQTKWYIPFSYVTGADDARVPPETNFSVWIEPSKSSVNITWDGNGWIKGNYGQTGFYRVNYPEANWDNLARQLEATPTVFSELDRYGLIDDSFNLARANMLNITKAMDITVYLTKETEYLPWKGAEMNLNYIKKILKHGGHTYRHLMKYLAFQSKTILKKLGYENTGTHLDKLQRLMAVHFQCEAGEKTCLGNMTAMFNEWKKDHMSFSVTPVLRKLVYHYGIALGTPEDWERVYNRIHTSVIASEMQPLLYGLAGSRDIWTLNKFLQMTMDQMKIKEQYSKHVIDFVANENPAGAEVAWSFIRANWGKLKKMSGGSVGAMLTYLPSVTKRFSTDYQLQQVGTAKSMAMAITLQAMLVY
ncbi:predicted protein [Nematostella vectensis]|uniref:glutamyl aminopeptidase n=1 Tax=Nematostella vectensis TaxID=45351 RepID=A7S5H5_NEMVE|nr:predicted protein [Nematostella vectensis]|eukprot:XP_001633073.1 predicted protein [Nematostella vectensis]